MRILILLIFSMLATVARGQIEIDFTSSTDLKDFFLGDTANYEVIDGLLKLNAPSEAGKSTLYTPSNAAYQGNWGIDIGMDFNPSSANYLDIYFLSNETNDTFNLGYFIRLGSADDDIKIYKKTSSEPEIIFDGSDDFLNVDSVDLKMQLERKNSEWTLTAQLTGKEAENYIFTDSSLYFSDFFMISCYYTTTRSDRFYFDNISISGIPSNDTLKAEVDNVVLSNEFLLLDLNEPVFNLKDAKVTINEKDCNFLLNTNFIEIFPGEPLRDSVEIELHSFIDKHGNDIDTTLELYIYYPKEYDIMISEIMADPAPAERLPEAEYLEVYNNSPFTINLSSWIIEDKGNKIVLPDHLILPGEYLVLCNQSEAILFPDSIKVLGLSSFISLNNDVDSIYLKNFENDVIDFAVYDISLFQDPAKREGGWSLERDIRYPCRDTKSWWPSTSVSGGTPGNEPTIPSELISGLLVDFSFIADTLIFLSSNHTINTFIDWHITGSIPSPVFSAAKELSDVRNQFRIPLSGAIDADALTNISIKGSSCRSNVDTSFVSGIMHSPAKGDIVINELLFEPSENNTEFIEIYNSGNRIIDLSKVWIGNLSVSGLMVNEVKVSNSPSALLPGHYVVLTESAELLKHNYPNIHSKSIKEVSLPSMPISNGEIAVANNDKELLEFVYYDSDWHHPQIENTQNVSLERISPETYANRKDSWHSASFSQGYATPGFENSQKSSSKHSRSYALDTKIISPNGDGYKDFVTISLENHSGSFASAIIFSKSGSPVRRLFSNRLLGDEDIFTWDGTNDDSQMAQAGFYIILIEIISESGESKNIKEVINVRY